MKWDFIQNDEQLDLYVNQIADVYHQLTLDMFDEIINKLKARGTANLEKTPYIWQLEKMNDMHLLNEANVKLIVRASGIAEELFRKIIADEGYKIYQDTKQQLLEDMGRDGTNVDNYEVQRALQALATQSFREVDNLINTSLPQASRAMYQDIVTQSVASVVTGTKSAEQAVSEATMSMFKRGFTGFTDRGGKRWKADVYARNMIKSTVYRTYREMREKPAEEVGIDTFYYSVKASAREMCAPLQGQIVTKGLARMEAGERILSLLDYGYGEPGGCLGINCGHVMTPFIPGVNYKPELPDELKNLTEEQAIQNANVEAKQRALERQIRYNKEMLHVAEQLGDKGLIQKYKLNDIKLRGALDSWIKKHDFLRYDMERVKYHKSGVKADYKNVIPEAEYERMAKRYKRYKDVLGDKNVPKSLDDLIKMKYNDSERYGFLKDYFTSRKSNMISAFSSFGDYVKYKNRVEKEIVGQTTSDGIVIKSQSKHFIERLLGTNADPKTGKFRSGVEVEHVIDALKNGRVRPSNSDSTVTVYYGEYAKVTVNNITGQLIQTVPQTKRR
ncbi:phage minor capsid protein [Aerococcaceae bacterium zg-ZUI334]|uniref:phage minor capsid protein n=1 Tax=Aerococcaceae bacterium zg-252 TaxID=2796928 RepID=UPI001BA357B3|nr:phage minor capsid protein [Aerococcaceae bacterium zg-ZUI334]